MNFLLDRDYRLDAFGLVGLLATLFLGASLASYDPADPPSSYVFPENKSVRNCCGPLGAKLALSVIELLGYSSYALAAAGASLTGAFFQGQSANAICRRTFGCVVWIPSAAGLVQLLGMGAEWSPVAGPGGILGAMIANLLRESVSEFGSYLLLVPLCIAGVPLTFGRSSLVVFLGAAWLLRIVGARARKVLRTPVFARPLPRSTPAALPSRSPLAVPVSATPIVRAADLPSEPEDEPAETWEHPREELRIMRNDDELESATPALAAPFASSFELPSLELLDDAEPFAYGDLEQQIRERAWLLEKTFEQFAMAVKVVQIDTGPVVTQYEIELEPGLRARKVMALSDDLAIALRAQSVRIVAPIPGKNTVGIEVPNEKRAKVGLKEVMTKSVDASRMRLPLYLGKDVKGQSLVCDLANLPHLLIAGRTGTGKSVCLNALILSILMTRSPDQVKMLMIDPKMVELSQYKEIPHLLHPVVTDMKKAEALLAWAVEKMDERYELLARVGARHIDGFNQLTHEQRIARYKPADLAEQNQIPRHLPYIIIFADEMADLMMTAPKEVESHIIRLAQKSRAVGIHLVLATQKPTVDVITGLIKSNLPARIAFQVASRTDSRVVLDEMGADKLLGNGDMLFLYPGTSKIVRAQGTYVADDEINRLTNYLSNQAPPQYSRELLELQSSDRAESGGGSSLQSLADRDEFYEQAIDVVVHEQRGSVSLLQRALGIGYGRAARLIDYMAEDGIVGTYNGSQARDVLYTPEQWEQLRRDRFSCAS